MYSIAKIFAVLIGISATGVSTAPRLDPDLKPYAPSGSAVSGKIKIVGSDTMLNLSTFWGSEFRRFYPGVQVEVEGKGSSTAPPALIDNQAQFGPMSRSMAPSEIDEFDERRGFEPTELRVAIDCVAMFVHRDNPIESLSLDQVEEAFSVAGGGDLTWGDLGVSDPAWARKRVSLYGRNSASGTYKYFKTYALADQDYRKTVKEQPGSAGVVNAISTDRYGLGYSGVGYRTPDVKTIGLSFGPGEPIAQPTQEGALSGDYPLARFLYMYVGHDPREEIDPLQRLEAGATKEEAYSVYKKNV
ncbi:MAG: phosphate ABC transporter substrate-binding protein, partial [Planctomycetota bacterium]